ncbi:FAD-dependent oxidoreductase [Paludibacterium denitrificans]|uniref:FAD-dependent oxidoreductase n=1 Tax=Paludibacterium denitrificans TaxID=2675226 RepID=UPI0035E44714
MELAPRADVTLFEAGRVAGGRARALGDGSGLDNGQHILIGAYAECLRLMRTVGLEPDSVLRREPMNWIRLGGLQLRCPSLPAPWHVALGLLMAKGLSIGSKLRLAWALQKLRWQGWRLAEDLPVLGWLQQQRQSPVLIEEFWRPLVLSALNTPPERASMQVLATVLRDSLGAKRAASDLLLPKVDLSTLFPNAALAWLQAQGVAGGRAGG